MKKKLSKALQAAIKRYLDNRDNQSNVRWDKPADQANIAEVAKADGFAASAQCAGSWWFTVKRGKNRWVFYTHEDNYTQTLTAERSAGALGNLLGKLYNN